MRNFIVALVVIGLLVSACGGGVPPVEVDPDPMTLLESGNTITFEGYLVVIPPPEPIKHDFLPREIEIEWYDQILDPEEPMLLVSMGGATMMADGPTPTTVVLDVVGIAIAGWGGLLVVLNNPEVLLWLNSVPEEARPAYFEVQGVNDMYTQLGLLNEVLVPLSGEHNPEHTPLSGEARARVEELLRAWKPVEAVAGGPGDPGQNIRCVLMKLGEETARWIIWRQTHLSTTGIPRGDLVWFDDSGWRDSYADKSGGTLTNVPKDLRENNQISMEEVGCDQFPPLPPLAPTQ